MTHHAPPDVLAALRAFRRSPGTGAVAVVTLATAVGLTLAMFGLIHRALFSPPAHVVDPDRVFTLAFEAPGATGQPAWMTTTSYVTFEAIRDGVPAAAGAAAWQRAAAAAVVVDGSQIAGDAMLVSGAYFTLLGARPLFGRGILPADDEPPAVSPVAVLSYRFWTSAFGGDPRVLGRRVAMRGIEFTVAGVMPAGFSGHTADRVDLWLPIHAALQHDPGWDQNRFLNIIGVVVRVPGDRSRSAAEAQATGGIGRRVTLSPIAGAEVRPAEERIAYWLAGVALLVLLIGLANAATLLLVRAAGRRRDLAIQVALGATRGRLLTQVGIEAALFAAAAVATALAMAYWFDEAVRQVLLPTLTESGGLNRRTLGAAAICAAAAFGASAAAALAHLPARFRRDDLAAAGRAHPGGRSRQVLLVVQTALSVLLLAGTGLLGRSLYNLVSQDFGMRMHDVLLVQFERGPGDVPDQHDLFTSALERVRALPGVDLATPIQMVPFTGFHVPPIGIPGMDQPPNVNGQLPFLIAATPELLRILEVRLLEGRGLVEADDRGAAVVLVNETMARTVWPGEGALGKCIRIGFDPSFDPFTAAGPPPPPTTVPCREVVGVVADVRQRSLVPTGREAGLMQYYVPFSQVPPPPMGGSGPRIQGLMLRAPAGPEALAAPIRRIVTGGRADLPFLQVRRYPDLLERQMRPWRQGTTLFAMFGALALAVAAVGLYAAFAHSVGERRREMAVRLAIGARPRRVLLLILREAGVLAGTGIAAGIALAVAGGRWLESMLFRTAPSDPLVLAAAAALMLAIAAAATWLPARLAARTDPASLLRAE